MKIENMIKQTWKYFNSDTYKDIYNVHEWEM